MSTTPEPLLAAQRAVLEASRTLGVKGVETAARLFELQCEATRRLYAAGPQSGGVTDDMLKAMHSAARANDYMQQLSSIWLSSGEVMRLMQTQAERLQSLFNESVKLGLKDMPSLTPMWPGMPQGSGRRTF